MPELYRVWFFRIAGWLHRGVEAVVLLLFVAMLTVGFAQIINRFFFAASLSWSEDFQRYAHIWLVFLAIPIGYRRGIHIGVDLLESALSPAMARRMTLAIDICWLVLGTGLVITALRVMEVAQRQRVPSMGITMDMVYLGLVLGGSYIIVIAAGRILVTFFPALGNSRP
jgi:TRAP-type transport system small permease protein